jgi:hypothetical protein
VTFTELEYVLMIAVAVMLWRMSAMSRRIDWLVLRSDRYADFLIKVGKKEGRVILNENGIYEFKPNKELACTQMNEVD